MNQFVSNLKRSLFFQRRNEQMNAFLFLMLSLSSAQFIITNPAELASEVGPNGLPSYGYLNMGLHTRDTFSAVFSIPSDPCSPLNPSEVGGTIVLVYAGYCPEVQKFRNVWNAGGVGFVAFDYSRNGQDWQDAIYNPPPATIPAAGIWLDTSSTLFSDMQTVYDNRGNTTITGYLTLETTDLLVPWWILYTILFELAYGFNLFMAGRKFFRSWQHGDRYNLAQVVLGMEIIVSTWNMIFNLDPGSGGRGLWSNEIFSLILSKAWPITLGAALAMAFYWQEAVFRLKHLAIGAGASYDKNLFRVQHRPMIAAFWIISLILLILDWVLSFCRAFYVSNDIDTVYILDTACYMATAGATGVFFIWSGVKQLRGFNTGTDFGNTKMPYMKRVTKIILSAGCGLGGYFIGCILFTYTAIAGTQVEFLLAQFFIYASMCVVDISITMVFVTQSKLENTPTPGDTDESSSSSSSRDSKRYTGFQEMTASQALEMAEKGLERQHKRDSISLE